MKSVDTYDVTQTNFSNHRTQRPSQGSRFGNFPLKLRLRRNTNEGSEAEAGEKREKEKDIKDAEAEADAEESLSVFDRLADAKSLAEIGIWDAVKLDSYFGNFLKMDNIPPPIQQKMRSANRPICTCVPEENEILFSRDVDPLLCCLIGSTQPDGSELGGREREKVEGRERVRERERESSSPSLLTAPFHSIYPSIHPYIHSECRFPVTFPRFMTTYSVTAIAFNVTQFGCDSTSISVRPPLRFHWSPPRSLRMCDELTFFGIFPIE